MRGDGARRPSVGDEPRASLGVGDNERPPAIGGGDEHASSVGAGQRAALTIVWRLWVGLLALGALGIAAGLAWHDRTVLGLALVIMVEETLEASVLVAVLKRSGAPLRWRPRVRRPGLHCACDCARVPANSTGRLPPPRRAQKENSHAGVQALHRREIL